MSSLEVNEWGSDWFWRKRNYYNWAARCSILLLSPPEVLGLMNETPIEEGTKHISFRRSQTQGTSAANNNRSYNLSFGCVRGVILHQLVTFHPLTSPTVDSCCSFHQTHRLIHLYHLGNLYETRLIPLTLPQDL